MHLDKAAPFKNEDGSYQDCSGSSYWEKTSICETCRDPQHCEFSICWYKRKPPHEPRLANWTGVSPEGIVTVHIPLHESDFQAECCSGCGLENPRAPHMPQDRLVCCDCSTHYCSLQCLEKDFPIHSSTYGCLANKGKPIMDYWQQLDRDNGESKVAIARKAHSAAQTVLLQAEQALEATMFARWGESGLSCDEKIAVDQNLNLRQTFTADNKFRCPICGRRYKNHNTANKHMTRVHSFAEDNPKLFRQLSKTNVLAISTDSSDPECSSVDSAEAEAWRGASQAETQLDASLPWRGKKRKK